MIVAILGRQPKIGIAELESLLGPACLAYEQDSNYVGISPDQTLYKNDITFIQQFPFERCGAVIKFAHTIASVHNPDALKQTIITHTTNQQTQQTGVKIKIGMSDYAGILSQRRLLELGLDIKKTLKSDGFSVRIVPNKTATLGSAQVLHNSLTLKNGYEFVIYAQNNGVYVAQTVHEQDITSYAARDQARPKRDARVGMLPPKLAQTIINLATGPIITDSKTQKNITILDPFCGTGVVLQEALLMGYGTYGTDINERMVDYSAANIAWLQSQFPDLPGTVYIEQGDATEHTWSHPFSTIAVETYLGEPLSVLPPKQALQRIVTEVNDLHIRTLTNLARQLTPGTRLCLAVPAWNEQRGFAHLPCLLNLEKYGFTRLTFTHVKDNELLYYRSDQIVARELLVLQKI